MQAFRNRLYGGIQKGEYRKRKGAIKDARSESELSSQQQFDVDSELEMRKSDKPANKKKVLPGYDYPQGWENPMGGINVTGNSENPQNFSRVMKGSNPAGYSIIDANIGEDNPSGYSRTETPTEYGPFVHSQLDPEGGDPQLYQKYPEGFGGLPAHEGSYTEKTGPLGFGYQTAEAPPGRSLLSLMKGRFFN